jgi:feruloyl esterase
VQISNGFPIAGLSPEWDTWIKGPNGLQDKMSTEFYRWMVFHDGSWNLDRFNLDHDWKVGKARLAAQINADNPDLRAFVRRGGKLILYQGWADAAMSPENTINFYEAVRKRLGPAAADHARPLCAWPTLAQWDGRGSSDDAASFTCVQPK